MYKNRATHRYPDVTSLTDSTGLIWALQKYQKKPAFRFPQTIYQNVGATYVTLPYLTLQMISAETASLLTDDNNRGFEKFRFARPVRIIMDF